MTTINELAEDVLRLVFQDLANMVSLRRIMRLRVVSSKSYRAEQISVLSSYCKN